MSDVRISGRGVFTGTSYLELSARIQPGQGAGAAAEFVSGDAHPLLHRNEEFAQRLVLQGVEGEVLTVFEAASREEDGKVGAVVDIGVAEIAAIEDHGVIEQTGGIARGRGGECGEKIAQVPHLL